MSDLSVKVAVRVRPLVSSERAEGCEAVLAVDTHTNQVISNNNTDRAFAFDHAFGQNTTQDHIYNTCVKSLEDRLFNGFNATLLAYGQTGSGKTYTMGTADDAATTATQGIIPRTIASIFAKIRHEKTQNIAHHTVLASFVEIHNEELRDLLTTSTNDDLRSTTFGGHSASDENHSSNATVVKKKTKLSIREDKNGTVYVAGLVQKTIPDEASFAALLTQGSSKRATASTNMNAVSSRSHAILTVTLHRQVLEEKHLAVEGAHQMETTSHFRLVDLAGSERAKRTNASGKRWLLVCGSCVCGILFPQHLLFCPRVH